MASKKRDVNAALGGLLGNVQNPRNATASGRSSEVSLFGRQDNQIHYIDPKLIGPYSIPSDIPGGGQPFSMANNEEYQEVKESIQELGVKEPAIIRPWKYDGQYRYEMIAGHRRRAICIELGIALPCIITNIDDNEASVVMSITNTLGRKKPLPSELAWSYKIELDARRKMSKKPASPDACHGDTQKKGRVTEEIGKRRGHSGRQVSRYIRLTELLPDILKHYVDHGYMDINTGVSLSYLSHEEQTVILDCLQHGHIPNPKQGELIKELSQNGQFSRAALDNLLAGKKKPSTKPITLKLPGERISAFFTTKTKPAEMEEEIFDLLTFKREFFSNVSAESANAEMRAAIALYRSRKKESE